MAKLYPPYINGTIPAFYTTNQGTFIKVPFSMNKTVSISEVKTFALKIKTLNGELKGIVRASQFDAISEMYVMFDITSEMSKLKLIVGSYYKLQLAYIDNYKEEDGYYSTVGIIKYTTKPTVTIQNLTVGQLNEHNYDYTGVYSQKNGDTTEKLYSSYFVFYDDNMNILHQSDEKLHDNTTDDLRYEAHENYRYAKDFARTSAYYVQFFIKTTNLIELASPKYRIVQQTFITTEHKFDLVAANDFDNGCIILTFQNCNQRVLSGSFSIKRASSVNGWDYEEIQILYLRSVSPDKWILRDFNVEQGVHYIYSIQQFNSSGVYSIKVYSDKIYCDFEDAFLYDGEKQLRIRFNPKVTSFKTTIQEQKTDTIGYQYPFFTRNSHIYYKEFPISGLISYLMDTDDLFITKDEINFQGYSTDLTGENIHTERLFKMKVLEWLNNGQPKIFRSPGEGNYLVRLMNVSLSPDDKLNRMLHTFSCNAYEIGKCDIETLSNWNLRSFVSGENINRIMEGMNIFEQVDYALRIFKNYSNTPEGEEQWNQDKENGVINFNTVLSQYKTAKGKWFTLHSGVNLLSVNFSDMIAGAEIKLNGELLVIGGTQSYFYEVNEENKAEPIYKIEYNLDFFPQGLINYEYNETDKAVDTFQLINNVKLEDVPCQQFIGTSYYKEIPIYYNGQLVPNVSEWDTNIITILTNKRETISRVNLLRIYKRPVIDAYFETGVTLEDVLSMIDVGGQYSGTIHLQTENSDMTLDLNQAYYYLYNRTNILPIYQLRLARSDYREQFDYFKLPGEELRVISDYIPYRFEDYYIEKNLADFAPYVGYCFDPATGKIFKTHANVFVGSINGENIDIRDTEIYNYIIENELEATKISSVVLNEGVCCDLGYFKGYSYYCFDADYSKNQDARTYAARKTYEAAYRKYLLEREGTTKPTAALTSYANNYLTTTKNGNVSINANSKLPSYINDNTQAEITTFLNTGTTLTNSTLSSYYTVLDRRASGEKEKRDAQCQRQILEGAREEYLNKLNNAIETYYEENGIST